MKVNKQVAWLPKDWATGTGTVEKVQQEDEDTQLVVNCDGSLFRLSLWGDNMNRLIDKWGEETDLWKGKHIFILKEQKIGQKPKIVLSPQ